MPSGLSASPKILAMRGREVAAYSRPMNRRQQGRTADGAALGRAIHLLYARPVVFSDTYALDLVSAPARFVCRSRLLYRLFLKRGVAPYRHFVASTLSAMRYVEDRLAEAVHEGFTQYVVLGAGLDSFALRRDDLCGRLRVFEVDHPATQALKRERIEGFLGAPPAHLEFVPADFERQSLDEALADSSFDPRARTLFSWIASIPYVETASVHETFRSIARLSAVGSEVVFNFGSWGSSSGAAGAVNPDLERATERRGEPLKSRFDPEALLQAVCEKGYERVALLDSEAQTQRYFASRDDGLHVVAGSHLAHVRRSG